MLTREERLRTPGMPYLYLRISIKVTDDGFVYGSTKIQVEEEACLSRKAMCSTLLARDTAQFSPYSSDRAQQFLKDSITEDMDVFLKDFFTVSPRNNTCATDAQ